jgi:hypothetical protein
MCGPSIVDTDQALAMQVDALQEVYSVQSEALHTALNYDCTDFGQKNFCVTGGAHYAHAGGSANDYSALLAAAYKVNQNLSVGAYLNQVVSSDGVTGINMSNKSPLFSVFADWAENTGPAGLKTHIAGGYNQTDLTLTRTAIDTGGTFVGEPGVGHADLNTYGFSGLLTYGVPLNQGWLATPYAGLEYTNITREGYTEGTSAAVTAPLTFGSLTDGATTALAGLNVDKKVTERLTLTVSAGVEYDLMRDAGTDAAIGVLSPGFLLPLVSSAVSAPFNADDRRFRGTATFGGSFATLPGQDIVAGVTYREESFGTVNTVGVTAAYQVGF